METIMSYAQTMVDTHYDRSCYGTSRINRMTVKQQVEFLQPKTGQVLQCRFRKWSGSIPPDWHTVGEYENINFDEYEYRWLEFPMPTHRKRLINISELTFPLWVSQDGNNWLLVTKVYRPSDTLEFGYCRMALEGLAQHGYLFNSQPTAEDAKKFYV
jgi:hypothetical protein